MFPSSSPFLRHFLFIILNQLGGRRGDEGTPLINLQITDTVLAAGSNGQRFQLWFNPKQCKEWEARPTICMCTFYYYMRRQHRPELVKAASHAPILQAETYWLYEVETTQTRVSQGCQLSVNGLHSLSVSGLHSLSVSGLHSLSVSGLHSLSVSGLHSLSVSGLHSLSVSGLHSLSVGGLHGAGILISPLGSRRLQRERGHL
jgi:hypothetical protein